MRKCFVLFCFQTDSDKQRPAFDEVGRQVACGLALTQVPKAKGLGESPQEKEKELATLLDSLQTATHKVFNYSCVCVCVCVCV